MTTLDQQFREQSAARRFRTWLLAAFSGIALLLASIGIYGVMQVLTGLALGLVSSLALTRLLSAILFGVTATDPVAYGLSTALLVAVAAIAVGIPAWRASRADPLTSLRQE